MVGVRDRVVDPTCKIHNSEPVYETLVSGCRIDKARKGKLVNVPKSLKWPTVYHCYFAGIQPHEGMNWITYFMVCNGSIGMLHARIISRAGDPCQIIPRRLANLPVSPGSSCTYCKMAVLGRCWAMRECHSAGPVVWTLEPSESTATVTGMSTTSNS